MHHDETGSGRKFNCKVAGAHRIQTVLAHLRHPLFIHHAQAAGHGFTIQRVGGTCQCRAAQRQLVHTAAHIQQALLIAVEHLDIGQQMVRKTHRLRNLQMRKPRQNHIHMLLCHGQQRALQFAQQGANHIDLATQPQADIGGHLVIAAAPSMQALARIANELGQTRFDIQVHVFQFELPDKLAGCNLLLDLHQTPLNLRKIICRDNALGVQHLRMRNRTPNVGLPQTLVKKNTCGIALHQLAHRLSKQSRPRLGFVLEGVA